VKTWAALLARTASAPVPTKDSIVSGNTTGLDLFSVTDPAPNGKRALVVPADDLDAYDNHMGVLISQIAVTNGFEIEVHETAKLPIPAAVLKSGTLRAFTSGVVSVLKQETIPKYDPKGGAFGAGVHWCMNEWLNNKAISDKRHTYVKTVSISEMFKKAEVPVTGTFFIKFITKVMPLVRATVIKYDCSDIASWLRDRDSLLQNGASVKAKLEMPPCMLPSEMLYAKTLGVIELKSLNELIDSERSLAWATGFWKEYGKRRKLYDAAILPIESMIQVRAKIVFDKKNKPNAKVSKKGFTLQDVYEQMPSNEAATLLAKPYIKLDLDSDVIHAPRASYTQDLCARIIAGRGCQEVAREIASLVTPWFTQLCIDYERRQARQLQQAAAAMDRT